MDHHHHHHHHHHHRESMALSESSSLVPHSDVLVAAGESTTSSVLGGGSAVGAMHMQMSFYWGPDVTLLFPGWTSHTWAQYCVALAICFALALAFEALGTYRHMLVARVKAHLKRKAARSPVDSVTLPMLDSAPSTTLVVSNADRLAVSAASCATAALGYLVMLLAMTFNVGVFVAIVTGHFAGVYFFSVNRLLGEESTSLEGGCHS